jgi:translation initiation factor 1
MSGHKRIPTDGGQRFGHNPFGALSSEGLPPAPENSPAANPGGASVPASQPQCGEAERSRLVSSLAPPNVPKPAKKNRGRVNILRVKAGRGGKTVTVVKSFVGIGLPEKEQLARAMQKACGTGGTVKDGQIEIQGDKRAEVAQILIEANFRPIFAGG